MNLTKKTETEVLKVYDTWLHSYLNGDVATYNKYLDKDYHFIGSTANEEFLNKKDTTTFFENTADQLAGKCDLRNEAKIIEKFGELVFITHLFDAWFLNGKEYNFYGRFRFSNALKKNKEGWRFIYQHYSTPDAKAAEGESIGFEKISAENLQLREAISRRTKELEEKNRELEVEGALERIRAQAVAMKESTDLLDIVVTMRNEFTKLGHEAHYFWHMMWQSKTYEKAMTSGDGTKIGFVMQLPRHIHGDIPQLAKWEKSKIPTVVFAMDVKEAIDYVNKMVSLGDFKNIDPQAPTEDDIRHIGGLTFIMARTTHGEIGYSLPGVVKSPPKEDIDILVKFAGAFDLAHRRFLDLQKAEKQARETQIELSLERIRSRVTAMQESSDLFDVVVSMRNEFLSLGHQADYFWHMKWTKDTYEMSMTASDGNRLGMIITVPKFVHEQIEELHNWEESNSPYFVLALNGKDAWDYIEKMNTYGKYKLVDPHAPTEEDILHIGGLTFIIARTTHGEIGFSIAGKVDNPPKASIEILVRFASVFDLAYKRFEDLKKAEAQTRETQIELALEKVRSRTMAMQHSDELSEAAELLYQEFYKLGISPFSCGYLINDDTENQWNVWMTDANEESFKNFWTLPFNADHHIRERYESWQKMKPFHSTELKGDTNIEHHKIIAQYAPWKKSSLENLPDCLVLSSANFKYGHLLIVTGEVLSVEMQSILIRFAKVFEQTYIRFLDLEKAEIQTRETQVQLALEKVRSRTMAMQHSDELIETSELLFEQIRDLGIEVWSCGYSLWYDDDTYFIGYNPMPDGKMGPKFKIPLTEDIFFKTIRKAKRKGDEFLIFESKGKSLANTYKYMDTLPVVGEGMRAIVNMGYELPKFQVTHCGFFSHGHLMFITHQHYPEAHSIFKRFTKEFEQTYTRFLDLQKAEAQAREAQIEIAVERVRAEAMAMHATTDFEKVTQELLKQVQNLELDGFTGASILSIDENDVFTWWDFSSPGNISDPKSQLIKYDAHKYQLLGKEVLNKWKEGKNYMVFQYDLERLHIAVKEWEEINPAIAKEFKKAITEGNFTHQWNPCGRLANGLLAFDMIHPPNEDVKNITIKMTHAFEQAYIRFQDLKKAEAQVREAQIEAALEKVRSRSLAMHHANELTEVVVVIVEKLKELDIILDANGVTLCTYFPDSKNVLHWIASPDFKHVGKYLLPYFDHVIFDDAWKSKEQGDAYFSKAYSVEDKNSFFKHAFKHSDYKHFPQEIKKFILNNDKHTLSFAWQKNSAILIPSNTGVLPTEEEKEILMRFSNVFEQAYIRFMDLKKAEAQAREAQIENALEKVRSRSLAMQNSDELKDLISTVYKELNNLDLALDRCLIWIMNSDNYSTRLWMANRDADPVSFYVPNHKNPPYRAVIKGWKTRDTNWEYHLKGKVKQEWDQFVFENTEMKHFPEKLKKMMQASNHTVMSGSFHNFGCLQTAGPKALSEEQSSILTRFATVFNQAYTRFLDLKKAEAQTREAQIEAALERVRSRSMAMHISHEIGNVAFVLFQQLKSLGGDFWGTGFAFCEKDSNEDEFWFANENGIMPHVKIPNTQDEAHKKMYQGWEQNLELFSMEKGGKELKDHYKYMLTVPDVQPIFQGMLDKGISFPKWQKWHAAYFKYGYLLAITTDPYEDQDIFKRFAKVFEQAYTRFLDLKKAEAQAREAQIEAALEKVRSRTMAMQHSNELPEAANVLFTEIQKLDIPAWSCGYNILSEEKTSSTCIMSSEGEIQSPFVLPLTEHKSLKPWHEAIINNKEFFVYEQGGDDLKEHYQYMQSLPELQETFQQLRNADIALPSFQVNHLAKFTNGFLLFITYERIPEAQDIFQRFARVFEQTYTRFLDLQKAETQVRKAQIEAALERTRTQSMLMQRSEELDATSKVFHEQLKLLGIDTEFSYVWLPDETQDEHQFWVAWNTEEKGGALIQSKAIVYPLDKLEPYTAKCFKDWESGVPVHIHHIKPKEVTLFFSAWEELLKDAKKLTPKYFSDGLYYAEAFMKYGCFGINIKRAITEEESQILQRFSIEFERTYTRFLDLQKAEAQTREAQINLAVERVRAKALAMHKSEEIMEVVAKLKEEVMSLDIPDVIAATIFLNEDKDKVRMWDLSTLEKSNDVYQIPFDITFKLKKKDPHLYVKRVWENPDDYFLEVQNTKDFKRIIAWLQENDKHDVAIEVEEFIKSVKLERLHHAVKRLNNGKLVIDLLHPPSDEMETILTKMGAAFDLAYKRFEDLQRAEAQTKEARVEIALEKVRTVALGLETSEDMLQVAQVLYEQLLELGFSNIRNTIIDINNDEEETFLDYDYSHEMGGTVTLMTYSDDPVLEKQVKIIASSTEKFSETILEGKTLQDLIDMRKKNGEADDPRLFNADAVSYNLYAFGNGAIGISNFGRLKEREKELLNRFRNVFTFAYQRFSDLQEKEKQSQKLKTEKLRLEETLSHLQATQKQLIQSEKMASLGELTAGIAHEIQNPLNFVNNFSEVSNELIDEIDDEIANGDMEEVKAILNDIKQNLEKINHHGKRADAIVKGMLQHSRKSTAEKVPTNINKLADEYLRLAYHGLRAKDKSFNATLETEFDENIGMVKVIPQDMGRVILNLITNAFYATNEQKNVTEDNNFKPTVSVSTKKQKDGITISVKDNGNGIPKAVVDKIFQPFFTTKPTGEGTGLGLSMSYDIVTKGHGGELNVTTKKGEGTTFIISIPNIP